MKLAATVIYVDSVPAVLDFYRRAFGLEPGLVDLDVQLPGRVAHRVYQFASIDAGGGTLQFGTVEAGAVPLAAPKAMPWGQTVAYVRSIEGTFVGICSPLAE